MNLQHRFQLAIFISHPIQHFAPLFRELAQLTDVHVFYYSNFGQIEQIDLGFGVPVRWDVPLTEGYTFAYLPTVPWLDSAYIGPRRVNCGLWDAVNQMKWDAVWIFGYSSLNSWLLWFLSQIRHIPILYTGDSELLRLRSPFSLFLKEIPVRLFLNRVNGYLAVGDNNVTYGRRYGVPQGKIRPFVLPVDVARFQAQQSETDFETRQYTLRSSYQIPPNARVVLFCGKFMQIKRPLDLVRALQREELSDPTVIGVFVGSGDLEEAIRREGQSRVRITGFINQSEIPVHLAMADVLVVPSEADAHPLVVTEAGSLGIPAVVSDRVGCVGSNDMLRPGENGLTYPCGDIPALAQAISLILHDDTLRDRMSARSREIAESQSVQAAARHVVNALELIVRE